MLSVERGWTSSPWGILVNTDRVLPIQHMGENLREDEVFDLVSGALDILLTRPEENAYKIAFLFNLIKASDDLVNMLGLKVSLINIKTYQWQQILPAGYWPTGGGLNVNCASSERRIKKKSQEEN